MPIRAPCDDSFSRVRNFNLTANGKGTNADGRFVRDDHDCITDRRDVFQATLSYIDTETGQTQSAMNLSYRREKYRGRDSVFGSFPGAYGSQSDVTGRATGEVSGVGVNAGLYGAKRLLGDLFLDYYLGGATSRHEFNLNFERTIGTISADGNYCYTVAFAGAALSGETQIGEIKLTPRVEFDYVYTPGTDVDVVASLSGLSEISGLELDAISGGRRFAELRTDRLLNNGRSNLWINPRIAFYQSIGALDGACGFGGSLGIESIGDNPDLSYAFEIDGEWGEGYSRGTLSMSIRHNYGLGVISDDASLTSRGNLHLRANLEIKF